MFKAFERTFKAFEPAFKTFELRFRGANLRNNMVACKKSVIFIAKRGYIHPQTRAIVLERYYTPMPSQEAVNPRKRTQKSKNKCPLNRIFEKSSAFICEKEKKCIPLHNQTIY